MIYVDCNLRNLTSFSDVPLPLIGLNDYEPKKLMTGASSTLLIGLSGCSAILPGKDETEKRRSLKSPSPSSMYGKLTSERFAIPAVPIKKVPRKYWRQQVDFRTTHPVGTIIVNTKTFYLHHVQEGGKAMRYGVGLGRQGFEWSGKGNNPLETGVAQMDTACRDDRPRTRIGKVECR